jgi:hypothetical protein
MDKDTTFAVSSLLESLSREDFAIHLYNRQLHKDPFATVPFTPLYYVLDEVYFVHSSPVILEDLIGVSEVEIIHKKRFTDAAFQLNPEGFPVPKIVFPEDLFATVTKPELDPIPGMKTALQIVITNIVQEQRAKLIYDYFANKTSGWVRSLYEEIANQEKAHRKIFEHALSEITDRKKINMYCPICGKVISFEPDEGTLGGCGYCSSKFKLTIEDGDFIVKLRD